MTRPAQSKPETPAPRQLQLLPMELQIGDCLIEKTGEWQVVSRPYASTGGELVSTHVRKVGRPDVTDLRTWGAHERLSVQRSTPGEGAR